jgi:acetyl esterase/lipase
MTTSLIERWTRAGLPIIRFFQRVMPITLANKLIKLGAARVKLDAGLIREIVIANGVRCEWIIPKQSRKDHVLLYLHGGGFVFRLTPPHIKMCAFLAQNSGLQILMVDYRTAPQNPYPAALDDCTSVYFWLIKQGIHAQNIVVAGDSAGGNLTLTMLMKLRDAGHPLPAAAACLSPVTDLTSKANFGKEFKDPLIPSRTANFYRQSYLGNNDSQNHLISPINGNLKGLPPLLIHVGEEERLRDDAIRFTHVAKSAGVVVRLEIYPRMWHVWQINLALPQAIQSLDDMAQFFNTHL